MYYGLGHSMFLCKNNHIIYIYKSSLVIYVRISNMYVYMYGYARMYLSMLQM